MKEALFATLKLTVLMAVFAIAGKYGIEYVAPQFMPKYYWSLPVVLWLFYAVSLFVFHEVGKWKAMQTLFFIFKAAKMLFFILLAVVYILLPGVDAKSFLITYLLYFMFTLIMESAYVLSLKKNKTIDSKENR